MLRALMAAAADTQTAPKSLGKSSGLSLAVSRTFVTIVILAATFLSTASSAQAPPDQAPPRQLPPRAQPALDAQDDDLADRQISEIRLQGLSRVPPQKVHNNIRSAVGDPYDPQTVKGDVDLLIRLGEFKYVDAVAELQDDGSVALIFQLTEQAVINEVQVVGNKLISDQDLRGVVQLVPRGPRDDFLIQNAKRAIQALYRQRGHYLTTVSYDEVELDKTGILIFRIIEGPRVKVKAIRFSGNHAFSDDQLSPQIKTRTAVFLFRKGELEEEQLIDDVAALDRYYRDRGYVDVRVDRTIELSPDSKEAKVAFVIVEGRQYTLRSIRAVSLDGGGALTVFSEKQIAALLEIKPGDVYSQDRLRKSVAAIEEAYSVLGRLATDEVRQQYQAPGWEVIVRTTLERVGPEPQVDLLLEIHEGEPYRVGWVTLLGNLLTRDRVIRRELREGLTPNRPFNATELEKARTRLERTRHFSDVRITVQKEDAANPGYRDLLVEVKERDTGSLNFGAAVASDTGLYGEISLNQTNFDHTDLPESFSEFIRGKAFRGAGQRFNATLRPGTELFQYSMSLTEPHIFESEYAFTIGGLYRERQYQQFDESRLGGNLRLARQLGDVWNVAVQTRFEEISLDQIAPFAPTEIFADAGPDLLTTLGVSLTRTTIVNPRRPGKGSRLELSFDRYGALGGDFAFNAATAEYTVYLTVDEDFLGRKSTVRLSSRVGYIFGGGRAPTYERFYLGGRTLRGFEFRTVSPKGVRADNGQPSTEAIGGQWLSFLGAQYEFPIFQDAFSGVLFVDSGTVLEDVGFDDYRVSMGVGVRLHIPQLGELPIALDFAIPIRSEEDDEEQVFSFNIEVPF